MLSKMNIGIQTVLQHEGAWPWDPCDMQPSRMITDYRLLQQGRTNT